MPECPFIPYCKFVGVTDKEVLDHIKNFHTVCRTTSYGDAYDGNGSKETIEINNEVKDV